ncbi:UNVERIFIED_CONTAM: Beta-amyrin 28-monooxygenase [Sesamum radiatum]|uniref:Beta-amyrin 28-monooxygenase n=1 Tax=Sesamum radiatum TaxID=300843 RepID=A0AAW2LQ68_SESRA
MELFSLLLSIAFVAFTVLFITSRRSGCGANLPPGTFGWPIIGETIEFLFRTPEKFVGDRMKKYSPDIFKTKILGEKTAVICGPNGHKFLFSNEHKYFTAFRPHPMQHLFRSYQNKAPAAPPAPPSQTQSSDETKAIRQPGS